MWSVCKEDITPTVSGQKFAKDQVRNLIAGSEIFHESILSSRLGGIASHVQHVTPRTAVRLSRDRHCQEWEYRACGENFEL